MSIYFDMTATLYTNICYIERKQGQVTKTLSKMNKLATKCNGVSMYNTLSNYTNLHLALSKKKKKNTYCHMTGVTTAKALVKKQVVNFPQC